MKHDFRHLAVKRPLSNLGDIFQAPRPSILQRLSRLLSANTTYNYKGGYVSGTNTGLVANPSGGLVISEIKLDFAVIAAARSAAGQTALAAADVLQLFDVPAATWVPACFLECLTVEGETATISVGDGADTAGFIATANMNSAAGVVGSLVTSAFSVAVGGGKIYAATDTIDALLNTAAFNVGKARIMAVMVDLRAVRS